MTAIDDIARHGHVQFDQQHSPFFSIARHVNPARLR